VPQFLERFRQVVGVAARQRADERRARQQADPQRYQRHDEGQDMAGFRHTFIIPEVSAGYKVGGGGGNWPKEEMYGILEGYKRE
jgi:hypothetical protein